VTAAAGTCHSSSSEATIRCTFSSGHSTAMGQSTADRNRRNALAFYDLMFNQCKPREAIDRYAGATYTQHNPHVADGKQAFIDWFECMATELSGKQVLFRSSPTGRWNGATATSWSERASCSPIRDWSWRSSTRLRSPSVTALTWRLSADGRARRRSSPRQLACRGMSALDRIEQGRQERVSAERTGVVGGGAYVARSCRGEGRSDPPPHQAEEDSRIRYP
jgi:hypothetical protein